LERSEKLDLTYIYLEKGNITKKPTLGRLRQIKPKTTREVKARGRGNGEGKDKEEDN